MRCIEAKIEGDTVTLTVERVILWFWPIVNKFQAPTSQKVTGYYEWVRLPDFITANNILLEHQLNSWVKTLLILPQATFWQATRRSRYEVRHLFLVGIL